MDGTFTDQPIRFPRFPVVRKVRANNLLLVHPQIAVVVLVHVTSRRGTRHHDASRSDYIDARRKRIVSWMFIDNIRVFTSGEITDFLPEAPHVSRVLRAI